MFSSYLMKLRSSQPLSGDEKCSPTSPICLYLFVKTNIKLQILRNYFIVRILMIGNGTYNVKMKLTKDMPNWMPMFGKKIYYNAFIWQTPQICCTMKQALLSISANALRSCMLLNSSELSFVRIHLICQKCTPTQIMLLGLSVM